MLWLHGGGFFRGSPRQPEAHAVAQALARQGVQVATVGYRLAPFPCFARRHSRVPRGRGRYPLALVDVLDAFARVEESSRGGVILGGASAGACLAAAATLALIAGGSQPVGSVFAYGFFHGRHPAVRDRRQRSRGHRRFTHATWALNAANRNYVESPRELSDRFAFAGGHDVAEFPRTLMVNAERDNMRASGDAFAGELTASGVEVEHHVLPGSSHAFLNRPRQPDFETATALMARWACA
ncbi:alpha/beta hydrolase [Curtobacterium sp. MCPF17_031]|uniref:alpha/beta hydrolase n=1 Tax=Curtobacterium sp. MCPF17_031 TaxID=2175653 RepID=UPI000DA9872C|nr:alpha/beta hydrolase [Curtobacterium sp. MCPF17_031]